MVALAATAAFADHYADASGDVSGTMLSYGNPNIDLLGVDITNDATSISFTFTTNSADIATPNWVKLNLIMARTTDSGLDAGGNGWSRPYNLAGGAKEFIGGWVDSGGGFEDRTFDGTNWNLVGATYNSTPGMSVSVSGNQVTYTTDLATLGLGIGDTINFDATTTGGGSDGAWDALSSNAITINNPGDFYTLAGGLQYTIRAVPEPTTLAALGFGAFAMLRKRRK